MTKQIKTEIKTEIKKLVFFNKLSIKEDSGWIIVRIETATPLEKEVGFKLEDRIQQICIEHLNTQTYYSDDYKNSKSNACILVLINR